MKFAYVIECDNGLPCCAGGVYKAVMISREHPPDSEEAQRERERTPFRACGESPMLAIAALGVVAEEWANKGGSERWLATPDGQALADEIMYGVRPKRDETEKPS